jgi:hypothetical protein
MPKRAVFPSNDGTLCTCCGHCILHYPLMWLCIKSNGTSSEKLPSHDQVHYHAMTEDTRFKHYCTMGANSVPLCFNAQVILTLSLQSLLTCTVYCLLSIHIPLHLQ